VPLLPLSDLVVPLLRNVKGVILHGAMVLCTFVSVNDTLTTSLLVFLEALVVEIKVEVCPDLAAQLCHHFLFLQLLLGCCYPVQ
jgi:hypothetical protein